MHSFEMLAGHEAAAARMRQAVADGKVGHAYIISGEKGIGKHTLAAAFAKTLQCEETRSRLPDGGRLPDACGVCLSCRVFESGNHPDVIYVVGTKTKSIGVDDVRDQIIRPMNVKPFRYRYKIFIVGEAETLTPAAQNALLKTMEEPAPYGIFMLLAAHTHAFLPTILSRCVLYKLSPLPDAAVTGVLAAQNISDDDARFYTAFARGNIGRALALSSSEEFRQMREFALDMVRHIQKTDIIGTFALYKRFEKWKESVQTLLDMLYLCCRDLIVYKGSGDTKWITQTDAVRLLGAVAEETPLPALFSAADAVSRARRALQQNANFQLTIEMMLVDFITGRGGFQ